jgi:DNA gyrase subunit A
VRDGGRPRGGTLLTVAQNGYGKRTELEEYRLQSRGGVGIINIQTSDRNGKVVGIAYVHDDDELMLISQQGMILRMKAGDIRRIGRATQGVRLIEMEEGDESSRSPSWRRGRRRTRPSRGAAAHRQCRLTNPQPCDS